MVPLCNVSARRILEIGVLRLHWDKKKPLLGAYIAVADEGRVTPLPQSVLLRFFVRLRLTPGSFGFH